METNVFKSKCENCGSSLIYNPQMNCLSCSHCETNYILPKRNENAVLVRQYSPEFHPNQLNRSLIAYRCNSCGNTYYISSEEMSKKCPNCAANSSTIVEDEGLCADGIIPFKLTKKQASDEFLKYLRKHGGVSGELKKYAKNQKLMGVYIPVWNFKFNVNAQYSGSATEVKSRSDGSVYGTYKPIYGEKHKRIMSYDQSATNMETDDFLSLFDENDYSQIIPYTPEYTFGYRVDRINKDIHDYYREISDKAVEDVKKSLTKSVLNSHKEVSDLFVDAQAEDTFFNFCYVPVYVNSYTYRGKVYKTYISGTTGKVVGKMPTTFKGILKVLLKLLGLAAVVALLVYLFK